MHVIGQNDPRIDAEPALGARVPYSLPQVCDMTDKQIASARLQRDGKEDAGTCNARASIVGHDPLSHEPINENCKLFVSRAALLWDQVRA